MPIRLNLNDTLQQQETKRDYARDYLVQKTQIDLEEKKRKQQEKAASEKKKKEKKKEDAITKERDGVLGFLDSTLGRVGHLVTERTFGKEFVKNQDQNYREIAKNTGNVASQQKLNTTTREANGLLEKGADITGMILGEVAPYALGYGAADKALKATKLAKFAKGGSLGKDFVRGATAGTIVGTGRTTLHDLTGDDYDAMDYVKHIGLEAALAGGGDALIGGLARNLNLKGHLDELLKGSAKYDEKTFKSALDEAFSQKGNPVNVLAPTPKQTPDEIIQSIQKQFNIDPNVKTSTPKTFSQDELDFGRRQADEDAFIQEKMAPFDDMLNRSSEADMTWNTSVKQAKDLANNIKTNYGKIFIPEENWTDWGHEVPVQFRANRGDNKSGIDIYTFADQEGFSSVDEAVQFLKQIDTESKIKLKDLKPQDDMKVTSEQYDELVEAARKEFASSDAGKQYDSLIEQILGKPKEKLDVPVTQTQTRSDIDSILRSESPTDYDSLRTELKPPLDVAENGKEFSKRLNLQYFNSSANNSMYSYSEQDIKNVSDYMSGFSKFYDATVNDKQKFEFITSQLVKENITDIKTHYQKLIDRAEQAGRKEEVKRLKKELKGMTGGETGFFGKDTSSKLTKSAETEKVAYQLTDNLIQSALGPVLKQLDEAGISLAEAFEYQAAKNLDYHMNQGGHADYVLPKGWDEGTLIDVINAGSNKSALQSFSAAMKEIRDARLQYLLDAGLKTSDEYKLLAQNEFYIPMMKDMDWKKSSIELAMKQSGPLGKAEPNVRALGKGDETFFKNPIETLYAATYTSVRNSLRNRTHQEFARLAQWDKTGKFIRPTDKSPSQADNVIEVYTDGVVQNYEISPDLARVIEDMRSVDAGVNYAQKVTGFIGSLKTTSLSYQLKAIPRDFTQAIVNMDGNPLNHIGVLLKSFLAPKKTMEVTMKEGGAFHNAYKDAMGSYQSSQELAKRFAKENREMYGKSTVVDSENAIKQLGQKVLKGIMLPYNVGAKVGNYADSAPRLAAMKQVEREYLPVIKELEDTIANTTDPFEKQLLEDELKTLRSEFQQEKIYRARDVINYSRTGSSAIAKFFKSYWNFANTATQSVDRFMRQMRKAPLQTTAKVLTVSAPMMFAQEMNYRNSSDEDKKLYDDTPDYIKNTMYVFVVNGHRLMLPKPFEVALVTSPFEGLINLSHKYDEEDLGKKTLDGVMRGIKELVPLNGIVTQPMSMAQPITEVVANKKFYNNQPVNFQDHYKHERNVLIPEGKTQEDVSGTYSSDFLKMFPVNADYSEHVVEGYGGDLGKTYLDIFDFISKPSKDNLQTMIQNANPLQDYFQTKDKNAFFRKTYTDKKKEKE